MNNFTILKSHSALEESLFLLIKQCSSCLKYGLKTIDIKTASIDSQAVDKITAVCKHCSTKHIFYFNKNTKNTISPKTINNSACCSQIIDIVEYTQLALFYFDIAKDLLTGKTENSSETEYYLNLAKNCIDEALKFLNSEHTSSENIFFSKQTEDVYQKNPKAFNLPILKLHKYKIDSFLNNISEIKEIYSGLTGEKNHDRDYLKKITPKYADNKEVLKEIGRLIYQTLDETEKNKWIKK